MMRCFFFSNCNTPEPESPQYCNSVLHKSCEYYKARVEERLNRMRERQDRKLALDTYSNVEYWRKGDDVE